MANRYTYQFNGSFKPKMNQIEGFVSIGTGGQVNYPDQSGLGTPSGLSVATGNPRGLMPGQATAGVPTGWVGGFSGTVGLYGAGVAGVQRVATGQYVVKLSDDWVRLDSVQVDVISGTSGAFGTTGALGIDWNIIDHTVGLGNSIATGALAPWLGPGINPKNEIFIQFTNSTNGLGADLPLSSGFFLDIRVRDGSPGPQ